MLIEAFKKLDNIALDIKETEIESRIKMDCKISKESGKLSEYDFGKYVFRFNEVGNLVEVTADAPIIDFDEKGIGFNKLHSFLMNEDSNVFEKFGFIVSPKYGIAFDPAYFPWVTFLSAEGLQCWQNV